MDYLEQRAQNILDNNRRLKELGLLDDAEPRAKERAKRALHHQLPARRSRRSSLKTAPESQGSTWSTHKTHASEASHCGRDDAVDIAALWDMSRASPKTCTHADVPFTCGQTLCCKEHSEAAEGSGTCFTSNGEPCCPYFKQSQCCNEVIALDKFGSFTTGLGHSVAVYNISGTLYVGGSRVIRGPPDNADVNRYFIDKPLPYITILNSLNCVQIAHCLLSPPCTALVNLNGGRFTKLHATFLDKTGVIITRDVVSVDGIGMARLADIRVPMVESGDCFLELSLFHNDIQACRTFCSVWIDSDGD